MLLVAWASALVALPGIPPVWAAAGTVADIRLSDQCPPYLRTDGNNHCLLETLYDLYPGVNSEWGGYRVALPDRRDGYTPQQIDLGRYLFFDPILSLDRDLSCAHCHHPDFGLSDARATSLGRHGSGVGPGRTGGAELPRGAPALWNMAFQRSFFWDARADSLDEQIDIVLKTPEEMATNPVEVVTSLNAIPTYQRLFAEAFGVTPIRYQQVLTAITAFETSLVSLNSRYDRYIHGAHGALSEREINGLNIFRSFATRCSQCHTPPLFTSGQLATTGVPESPDTAYDAGAGAITGEKSLRGAFKVPTLRNIARTAPYMHSGQMQTLSQAIGFYNAEPGHAVPAGEELTLHWHMVNPGLRPDEIADLLAFLHSLTDETAKPSIPALVPSGLPVLR